MVAHAPVVQRFQLHRVVFRIRALQRIEENLPGRAVVGAEGRIYVGGQDGLLETIEYLLARVEGGGLVVVDDGDDRQTCERDGTQVGRVGDAVQVDFQRNRDLLFHFLSSVTGPLGDDLDVGIGDVGISLNR